MTSEKAYDVSQRVDAHILTGGFGPWTAWSPLSNSWAVRSPYTKAWVRWAPGNLAVLSVWATTGTATDGTTVGTIPASDSAGNPLRPAQFVQVPCVADSIRMPTTNPEGCYFQISSAGVVACFGFATASTFGGVSAGWYPLDAM